MQSLNGGGAEKVLVDILANFDVENYTISLCVLNKGGVYKKDIPNNIKLIDYLPWLRMSHFFRRVERRLRKTKLFSIYLMMEQVRFKRTIQMEYDAIISFMEGESLRYHSFIFEKSKNNISWVHTNFKINHWSSAFFANDKQEEQIYNMLSSIIFVSKDAQTTFNEIFKIKSPRQKVIYNLIDRNSIIHKSEEQIINKQKFTICCTGRLAPQKRFDRAIKAAKIVKDKGLDFELWLLGEGYLEVELKKLVSSLDLTDYIKFLGYIKNPYPIMKVSDLFLLTSDTEGYPLVVCEAISLGLPIVSTNVTGVGEILDNGKYGILTNYSETEIADALIKLISDKAELFKFSMLAQERSEMFKVENTMLSIYSLIE